MCWNKGDSGSPFNGKIMDYEKMYKEAPKRVRRLHDRMLVLSSTDALVASAELEFIFPELKESEDERIRRKMIEHFKAKTKETWCNMPVKDIIAYLEKQKEQEPDTRDADDLQLLGFIYDLLNEIEWKDNWAMSKDECLRRLNNYRPQKPKEQCVDVIKMSTLLAADRLASAEMTGRLKERKEILENPEKYGLCKPAEWSEEDGEMLDSIIRVVCGVGVQPNGLREKQVNWLKSLRPSWKPSEEQMAALEAATVRYQSTGLESLYEDLKKL